MPKPFPHSESIKVVPIHHDKISALKPAALPKLTYRNGPLLANVEVYTIYWGAGWGTTLSTLATTLNNFFTAILKSSLMTQMAEYNTTKYKIGNGKLTGTTTIATPAPAALVTDTQIQAQLNKWIKSTKAFPQPGVNTLYFIYLPTGVSVSMGGSKSCSSFCGYHNSIGSNIYYAVMPYPGCAGCRSTLSVTDALTGTSSHELCEAITDPIPGSGWYDNINGEIGDICAWKFKALAGYNVQLEWSNAKGKCI
jgi:hypothetical protein